MACAEWTSLTELLKEEDEQASHLHPSACSPEARFSANHDGLSRGQVVQLLGLKGRAELNGACGRLLRFDANAGRWHLQLVAGLETIKVRPENVAEATEQDMSGTTETSDRLMFSPGGC
eukprot:TRINITY_DN69418_c0_g1_i1.p3 TRINITY_DN69418_c0_g1~~TRINITY_DN69418_c0_g1_i1.p3  ORF type:complete len:119 (-),score=22.06 TRINITY_DN69418_c0_g1_i1:7-363(-)